MKAADNIQYIGVILPIALPKVFTYQVPETLQGQLVFGMRVEVQFGKSKRYAAIVVDLDVTPEKGIRPKQILSLIDESPSINEVQLQFWIWIANYYSCTIGEVMNA
ncbi:MAG: primosomal protein N', partial [Bacteroidota bacterium]